MTKDRNAILYTINIYIYTHIITFHIYYILHLLYIYWLGKLFVGFQDVAFQTSRDSLSTTFFTVLF